MIKRICPNCQEQVLDEKLLEDGGLINTSKCPECGNGCVRLNIFYWPLYPLIDLTIFLVVFIFHGVAWTLGAMAVAFVYWVLVEKWKLNERYGPVFKWHGA
ncbi:hypothetical protein [Thiosocius teredinicola]|uniref:hypothetical protein n=1 Tax=Thiosocius teredinicola TaxID=1973002 RepID=UPI000990EB0F